MAARFLADRAFDTHLRRLRQRVAAQTDAWVALARQVLPAGSRVSAGAGGHVVWVELPEGVDSTALLPPLRERGFSVIPGAAFAVGAGAAGPLARGLRLAAGHPLDALRERGLRCLGEVARAVRPAPATAGPEPRRAGG